MMFESSFVRALRIFLLRHNPPLAHLQLTNRNIASVSVPQKDGNLKGTLVLLQAN
jgi:hypothetical protein